MKIILTKDELMAWLKDARCVGTDYYDVDKCGNEERIDVYQGIGDDTLWKVHFYNDRIQCRYDEGKGWVDGEYEIIQVIQKTRVVEETYYEEI